MSLSSHKWTKWRECDKDARHMMERSYLSADTPLQFVVFIEKPEDNVSGHPVIKGSTATIILTPGEAVWIKAMQVDSVG